MAVCSFVLRGPGRGSKLGVKASLIALLFGSVLAQDDGSGGTEWYVLVFWVALIGAVGLLALAQHSSRLQAKDRALGGRADRASGLTYLGGHPGLAHGVASATVAVTQEVLAVERSESVLFKLPLGGVGQMQVETDEEARQRLTVTRMAVVGVFALAFPKKTPGSVLVTIDTAQGPLVFERQGRNKSEVLRETAAVRATLAEFAGMKPAPMEAAPAPPGGPGADGDEVLAALERLDVLRRSGVLTEGEFALQKARVLGTTTSAVIPPPAAIPPPRAAIPPPPGAPIPPPPGAPRRSTPD